MFCPLCKAEYRPGFTRCADCDIPLVRSLPEDELLQEPSEVLWEGHDPVMFSSLESKLREAGIEHYTKSSANHLIPTSPPSFEIYVRKPDLEPARAVLLLLLEAPLVEEEPSVEQEGTEESAACLVKPLLDDWDLEEATADVWAGEDAALGEFLCNTFRENRLRFRILGGWPGRAHLLVHPQDELRAREIVREVIEGTPPT